MPAKKKTSTEPEVKPVAAKTVAKKAPVAPAKPVAAAKPAAKPVKAATPAPAVKKAVAKPVKPVVPAADAAPKTSAPSTTTVSAEERYQMIQQAAYFLAERQGFVGDSSGHWIEAERQINEQLGIR